MTTTTINRPQKFLLGKIRLESTMLVETGLHIGGGNETLDIGGLDKPVIRDPITRHPYLPGSSIKGKLRAILERTLENPSLPLNRRGSRDTYRYESDDLVDGVTELDGNHIRFYGARTCALSRIFGSTGAKCWIKTEIADAEGLLDKDENGNIKNRTKLVDREQHAWVNGRNHPARLIVRDSHLKEDSARELEEVDTGLYMTEWKFENGLDRITAAANPRQVERVPRGAKFKFEMIYTVEDASQVAEDLKNLAIAFAILEDDALGGHGSRGYGKVKFIDINLFCKNRQQYYNPDASSDEPFGTYPDIAALLRQFGTLIEQVQQRLPGS